jgi:hypothetical protein
MAGAAATLDGAAEGDGVAAGLRDDEGDAGAGIWT